MRLIDANALKETINKVVDEEIRFEQAWAMGLKYSLKLIDNAPTVEANSIIDGLNNQIDDLSDELAWYVNERDRLLKGREPQGEWVYKFTEQSDYGRFYICSKCDGLARGTPKFCPHCGAKMKFDEVTKNE